MSTPRPMRTQVRAMGFALGAILPLWTASVHADLDLAVDGIGVGAVPRGGRQIAPQQVAISIPTNRVAFTLTGRVMNMGTEPIRWGFPVRELSSADAQHLASLGILAGPPTPWVDQNIGTVYWFGNPLAPVINTTGYSGLSEGTNTHPHYQMLPTTPDPNTPVVVPPPGPARDALVAQLHELETFYGDPVHEQYFVLKQAGGAGHPVELIGHSGLKHAFQTDPLFFPDSNGNRRYDPNTHFLMPGEQDTYGNNSNMDRDFLGPVEEIDPNTFLVTDHLYHGGGQPLHAIESGFHVYNRAHGEKDETDPFAFRL
ncbi:MAG: hypothetical protein L0Z62_36140, partial [Gemmataceae bacterium]|nr:hypothetical protein [Gemmataceae bacterium]